jgi:hypothetical protein
MAMVSTEVARFVSRVLLKLPLLSEVNGWRDAESADEQLLIRRVCQAIPGPARRQMTCNHRSHQFATFLPGSQSHTAKIRPFGVRTAA